MEHWLFNGHTWGGGGICDISLKVETTIYISLCTMNNMQNTYAVHLPYVIILKSARSR